MLLLDLILILLIDNITCLPIQEVTTNRFFPTRTSCMDQMKSQQIYRDQLFIDKFINSIVNSTEDLKDSKHIQTQFDGSDTDNSSNQLVIKHPKRSLLESQMNFEQNNDDQGEMPNLNNEELLGYDPNYNSNSDSDLMSNQEEINEKLDFQDEPKSFESQGSYSRELDKPLETIKVNNVNDIPYLQTDYKDRFADKAPMDTILIQNDFLLPTFNINDNKEKPRILVKPNWENENIEPTTYEEDPNNSMYKKYQRYNEKSSQDDAFPYKEINNPKDFVHSQYGSILDRFNLKIPTINIYTSASNEPDVNKFKFSTTYRTTIPSDEVFDKDTQNAIELASMKSLERSDILAKDFLRNPRLKLVTGAPIIEVELPNKDIYKQPDYGETKIENDNLKHNPYTSTAMSNDRDFFKQYTNKESVLDGDFVTVENSKQDSDKATVNVHILDGNAYRNGEFASKHTDTLQKKINEEILSDSKKLSPIIKNDNDNRLNNDQESVRNVTDKDEADKMYKQNLIKYLDESNKKQDEVVKTDKLVKNLKPDIIETEIHNMPDQNMKNNNHESVVKSAKGVKHQNTSQYKPKEKVMKNQENGGKTVKQGDEEKTKKVDQEDDNQKNDYNKWQELLNKIYKGMQQTAAETSPENLKASHQSAGKEDNLGDLLQNLETGRKSSTDEDNETILRHLQDDTTNIYRKFELNKDFEYSQDTDLLRKVDHVTRMSKKSNLNKKPDIEDELNDIDREQDGQFVRSKKYAGDFDDNWESIETKKVDILNKVDQKKVIDDVIQDLENSKSRPDDNDFRKRDIDSQENSDQLNREILVHELGDENKNILKRHLRSENSYNNKYGKDSSEKIFPDNDYNAENFDPLAKHYDSKEDNLDERMKGKTYYIRKIDDLYPYYNPKESQFTNDRDSYDSSRFFKSPPGRIRKFEKIQDVLDMHDSKFEDNRFQEDSDIEKTVEDLDKIDNEPSNAIDLSNENDYVNYFKSCDTPADSVIEKRLGIFGKRLSEHSASIKDETNKLISTENSDTKDAERNINSIKSEEVKSEEIINEEGITKKRSAQKLRRNSVTKTNKGNYLSENTKYRLLSDNISKRDTSSLPDIRMANINWKDKGPNSEEISQMSDDEFFGALDALTPEERRIFEEMAEDYDETSEEYNDGIDNLAVNEEPDANNIGESILQGSTGNKLISSKESKNIGARTIETKPVQINKLDKLDYKQSEGQKFKESTSDLAIGIDDQNPDKEFTVKKESVIDGREGKSMPTVTGTGDLGNLEKLKEVDRKIIEPTVDKIHINKKSIQSSNFESQGQLSDESVITSSGINPEPFTTGDALANNLPKEQTIPSLDITTQEKAQVKREIYVDNSEQHAIEETNEFKKKYDENEDLYPINSGQESYLVDKIPAGDIKNFFPQDKPKPLEKPDTNHNSNEKMIKNITDEIATGELKVSGNRSPLDIKILKNGLGNPGNKNDISKIGADSDDESDGANGEKTKKEESVVPQKSENGPEQVDILNAEDTSQAKTPEVNDEPISDGEMSNQENIANSEDIPVQVGSENEVIDQVNANADETKMNSINAIVESDKPDEINNLDDDKQIIEVPINPETGKDMVRTSDIMKVADTKPSTLLDKDETSKIQDKKLLSNIQNLPEVMQSEHIASENIGAMEEISDPLRETVEKSNMASQDELDISDNLRFNDETESVIPDILTDDDILESDSGQTHDTVESDLHEKLANENLQPENDNVNSKPEFSVIPMENQNAMPDSTLAWKTADENQERSHRYTQLDIENERFLDKLKLENWDLDKSDEVFNNLDLEKPVVDLNKYNQIQTPLESYSKDVDQVNDGFKKTDQNDVILDDDASVSKRMDWLIMAKLYDRDKRHKNEVKDSRKKNPPPIPIPIPFPI